MRNKEFVEGRQCNYYIVSRDPFSRRQLRSRSSIHGRYPQRERPALSRTEAVRSTRLKSQQVNREELWKPKTGGRFSELVLPEKRQSESRKEKLLEAIKLLSTLSEEEIVNVVDYAKFVKEEGVDKGEVKSDVEVKSSATSCTEVSNVYGLNCMNRSAYIKKLEQKVRNEKKERIKLLQRVINLSKEVRSIHPPNPNTHCPLHAA
eukprot:TRINITY_DN7028_c0_g1_i10.p1 TRINITY_DN7028_c0_g1~~TRINITY_DN7028_c0_g1_i10.p1  ORF type:complete len:205 (+),score=52.78 TRINITY_DN7028_c0_g1_i10:347-961(+)